MLRKNIRENEPHVFHKRGRTFVGKPSNYRSGLWTVEIVYHPYIEPGKKINCHSRDISRLAYKDEVERLQHKGDMAFLETHLNNSHRFKYYSKAKNAILSWIDTLYEES